MEIRIKPFSELSAKTLYDVLALRTEIFVVEQKCAYQEVDHHDQQSIHVMGYKKEELVAYARIVAPQEIYEEPSIGRVCVKLSSRNAQLGRQIFEAALKEAESVYPETTLKIQAQVYLEDFYTSLEFKTISQPYLDFGIWHVDMIKTHP
ncbi:MAG: GNAT family N-acetyltransferase [Owenweeksia sp.]